MSRGRDSIRRTCIHHEQGQPVRTLTRRLGGNVVQASRCRLQVHQKRDTVKMKLPALILVSLILQLIAVASGPDLAPPCKADIPLLRGADRRALWLTTPQLLEQATHCEAPKVLPLVGEEARIQGTVTLSILVGQHGEISCVKGVSGHPLLLRAALDAARKWKFKPMIEDGKSVGFYGALEFHFSTDNTGAQGASCLEAH